MASIVKNQSVNRDLTLKNGTKLVHPLLQGKVAIITGSSRGIGKGIAKVFAEQGCKVVINGRNADVCNKTVDEIRKMGGEAFAAPASIVNVDEVQEMVDRTVEKYGKVDILVNNAGTSRDALIHKMDDDLFKFIVDLNLKGTHIVSRAVIKHFLKTKSKNEFKKIVNVSSITGVTGNFGQCNYAVAKSGIIGYSKATARELSLDRINVNVIAPGFMETRMTEVKKPGDKLGMPKPLRDLAISTTPFSRDGHAGKPKHCANVALFMCSELGDWITGQILTVDGGMYI